MSADDIDKHLDRIRATRLRGAEIYQQVQEEKKAISDAHTRAMLDQHLERLQRQLDKIDKFITTTELVINKVRVARITLGMQLV